MLDEDTETFSTLEAQRSATHTALAMLLFVAGFTLLAAAPALVIITWRAAL